MDSNGNTSQNRSKLRKNRAAEPASIKLDPFKLIGLLISLIGIGAWIAGESYNAGRWSAAKDIGPIMQPTLQQTAFIGFIGPVMNWMIAAMVIVILGMLVGLASIQTRTTRKPPKIAVAVGSFFQARFTVDGAVAEFGQIMMSLGFCFVVFVIVPLVLWVYFAYLEGAKSFQRNACEARYSKTFPSTVRLADGTKVTGRIIDQSDKENILLDQNSIYLVALGEKAQILSTTSVADVTCPARP